MVAMLMGNQHGIQVLNVFADSRQPGSDLLLAQAGVDQDAGARCRDERRVARTAARQYADFDDDAVSLPKQYAPQMF